MATIAELYARKLHKHAREGINSSLEVGEEVQVLILGQSNQALIGTDRRVFIFKKGVTSGAAFGKQLNSWDYRNVSGVQVKRGMSGQAVVVDVPGVAPVTQTGQLSKGPSSAWEAPNAIMTPKSLDLNPTVATLRRLIAQRQSPTLQVPPGSQPAPKSPDPVEEIRRYAALRDEGLITGDEYEAKKRQLLGS